MSTQPDTRFTIGNMMVAIAVVALSLAVILTPGLAPGLGAFLILLGMSALGGFLGVRRILELLYGIRCPHCRQRGLQRKAIQSFGERFYLCGTCGVRCRRSLLGAYGLFFWRDASGSEFDGFYSKPVSEDPWNAPPGLEDDDYVYSKTHLNLVRNKRRRSPDNPNGPGLE